jgi:hypothetical protein
VRPSCGRMARRGATAFTTAARAPRRCMSELFAPVELLLHPAHIVVVASFASFAASAIASSTLPRSSMIPAALASSPDPHATLCEAVDLLERRLRASATLSTKLRYACSTEACRMTLVSDPSPRSRFRLPESRACRSRRS